MEEEFNDTDEHTTPDFRGYTEEQLLGVLRFTKAISEANKEIDEAVTQARKFAAERNAGRTGQLIQDDEETALIRTQVRGYLKRTGRKPSEAR